MKNLRIFLIPWIFTLALGLSYPLSVGFIFEWRKEYFLSWLFNDIVYNVYFLVIFPFLAGTIVAIFDVDRIKLIPKGFLYISFLVLSILCIFLSYYSYISFEREPRSHLPIMLPDTIATQAAALDICIRETIRKPEIKEFRTDIEKGNVDHQVFRSVFSGGIGNCMKEESIRMYSSLSIKMYDPHRCNKTKFSGESSYRKYLSQSAICEYFARLKTLSLDGKAEFSGSNIVAFISKSLSIYGSCVAAFTIWYIILLGFLKTNRTTERNGVLISYGIILIWFPVRMINDYYYSYYNFLLIVESFPEILTLSFAFLFVFIWLLFALNLPKIGGLVTALIALIPIGGAIYPDVFEYSSLLINSMSLMGYFLIVLFIIVTFSMIVYRMLHASLDKRSVR